MASFDITSYGPVIGSLLKTSRLMPLGTGSPNPEVFSELKALSSEKAFGPARLHDQDMAKCCLAGLWLYHDYLDESHSLSQEIETPTGSYWHGLMHRREPDYGNAKYWFRKVGDHPIFESLGAAASQIISNKPPESARFLARQTAWDPFAFIDLCEKASGSDIEMHCRRIQQKEWELLFDFSYSRATNVPSHS